MELDITDCSTLSPTQLEAWLQLFESVPNARFYHHPYWLQCVATHLSPSTLSIAFAYHNEQLQMVVPLCDSAGVRRRSHPAHDHLSLSDILFHPDLADQPDLLFSCLDSALCQPSERWLDWQISNVPQFSPLVKALAANNQTAQTIDGDAPASTLRIGRNDSNDRWMMKKTRQSASFDCTNEACPPHGKLRRNLRRLRKQLADINELRVEHISEPAELKDAFEHFLQIEASGWKGQGVEATAISANPELVAFYGALLTPSSAGITPEINLLWSGDDCTAAQFGLRTGKCLSLLKIGYNEAFARFSPGYLLLESVLAEAPSRGIDTLSLVTSPAWSERWHPDTAPVWHINRYNNSALGAAKHQIDRLKQLAKSKLRKAA